MTPEAWVVVLGAPPVFGLGWFGRGIYDSMRKDTRMAAPTKRQGFRPFNRLFDWFSHGNRLVGLCLSCALLAGAAMGYTFTADQQSENRTTKAVADVVSCIADYVTELSVTSAPRTAASVAASDARRDWDRGSSEAEPGLTKAELLARYLRLYARYEKVRAVNPTLTPFSLAYCEAPR